MFRMMSCYYTTVGFYVSSMVTSVALCCMSPSEYDFYMELEKREKKHFIGFF